MKNKCLQYLLTFPPLTWLFLFFFLPTCMILIFSFKSADVYGGIEHIWTFKTIQKTIFNHYYPSLLLRTLIISSLTSLICLVLALPVAYTMSLSSQRVKRWLLLLLASAFWTNFLVRIFAWKALLHPEGFIKQGLVALNLCSETSVLLYNHTAIILVMVYSFLPFAIFPLYTACEKFDFSLIEAALDLGASRLQAFISIFLPNIRQGIIGAAIMIFIPALGSYVIPEIIGGTNTELIGSKIAQRTFTDRNLPAASALSSSLFIAIIISFIAFLALSKLYGYIKARRMEKL